MAATRLSRVALVLFAAGGAGAAQEKEAAPLPIIKYQVKLETIHSGFDRKTCWVHPRAGAIPGNPPSVVLTMQRLLLSGSDVFYALNEMRTDDLGGKWSGPVEHATLARRREGDIEVCICDFTPKWHAKSGKLLGIGQNVHYRDNRVMDYRHRQTAWSVYDPAARSWAEWRTMEMPDNKKFFSAGAGSVQRYDLPNGDILLPIYFKGDDRAERCYTATVLRCTFDGRTLSYAEHGTELTLAVPRGFAEPSLACLGDRYYLTLRNDQAGYVTSGPDGLRFDKPVEWRFDEGQPLGNYNTQQHWVAHPRGLLLVYTRRGANNDHVFRHRARLFIAQVDPERLCVVRRTERILVPERGARLGNFGVCEVSDAETWVTVAEWMQPVGCEKYGSDNSVYVARIVWE
ncbi:MAG: exo-alpha-sialidase [Planctomycetes bacterium]|nr:exo-alpha-sialidase [Planctomycetota bacterium]